MHRLYQWLTQRASSFRSDTSDGGTSRTVRTEVTVERQGMTLLVVAWRRASQPPALRTEAGPSAGGASKTSSSTGFDCQTDLPVDGTSP